MNAAGAEAAWLVGTGFLWGGPELERLAARLQGVSAAICSTLPENLGQETRDARKHQIGAGRHLVRAMEPGLVQKVQRSEEFSRQDDRDVHDRTQPQPLDNLVIGKDLERIRF